MLKTTLRYSWLIVGWVSLIVGIIGLFVPLLPTTPFVILTGYCFSKGSQRMHQWIINHRYLGLVIRNWNENRSIPLSAKWMSSVMMVGSIVLIHWHPRIPPLVQWGVSAFLVSVIIFVLSRPSTSKVD